MITMALMAEKDADLQMRLTEARRAAVKKVREEAARECMEKNRIEAIQERTDRLLRLGLDSWLDDYHRKYVGRTHRTGSV